MAKMVNENMNKLEEKYRFRFGEWRRYCSSKQGCVKKKK